MITVILGIAIIVVLTRLLIKVILDGADDYSQGIISFSATVFKSIGFTMLDTGLSGAFAVGGLNIIWVQHDGTGSEPRCV